jgi:ADP-ribose pyrophosphatase YjhB (NUDIX family)
VGKISVEFEKDFAKIEQKIVDLNDSGYDRIHLPGGTAIDGSFYAGAVIAKYDFSSKEFYFLGVPYSSKFHLKGESKHNKKFGEFPQQAVIREVLEETGIQITSESLILVWEKKVPDNRPGKLGKFHCKYVYLVNEFTGSVFTFEGPNPIDGETAAPVWIPALIFADKVFGGHKEAVGLAMEKLMAKKSEYVNPLIDALELIKKTTR